MATQDDYKVDLEVFEGPLDLLLYLIKREEVDIHDIPIVHVTTQYMTYLDMMRMLDLNIAGEFIVMAATLMMIKSRMLLPVERRDDEEEQEEEADPRWDLVRQLVEYKRFKDAALRLQGFELHQEDVFEQGAMPEVAASEEEAPDRSLEDVSLFDLLSALQEVLKSVPEEEWGHLEPILWSVPDKMDEIIKTTSANGSAYFSALFREKAHRNEVIVTFLALLELLRLRQVTVRQTAVFGEMEIRWVPEGIEETALPVPPVA